MNELIQQSLFDYAALDVETRLVVQQRTTEIKSLMKRAAQDIIEIGQKLIEVKARLGHGKFLGWIEIEFDWHRDTANKFIHVAEQFSTIEMSKISTFAPSALYLLAAPSTPELARIEALNRANDGETITYSTAKEITQFYKDEGFTPIYTSTLEPELDEENEQGNLDYISPPPKAIYTSQRQDMTLLTSSKNDSWRTPKSYIEAAREVMGGIDLDPASSEIANDLILATYYYTKEDDGLSQAWQGRVWLNPPYGKTNGQSNQGLFAHKLVTEYNKGNVDQGILLVNLYTGYGWFAPLRELPWCVPDHRISFIDPETNEEGDEAKASSVFIYFGPNVQKFFHVFSRFGVCCQPKYYR